MTNTNFWARAMNPVPKEEEPIIPDDFSGMSIAEYAQARAQLGVRDMSNVQGLAQADDPVIRGREIAKIFQPKAMPDSMAQHAEARQEAGVRDASDIFGASRPNPLSHRSPYSAS